MNDYTYEYQDRNKKDIYNGIYETYGWDNTWIERLSNRESKRVLYIGDSISAQIRRLATAQTKEELLFDGFATSKNLDNPYLKDTINIFAAQLIRTDAVIFNNGLHGWHLSDNSEYGFYYEEIIKYLLEKFKGIPLFIALTTWVQDESRKRRVWERNKAALKIAEKYKLPVIDLYSVSKENNSLISSDGVHFLEEGNEILAKKIIEIMRNLK